MKTYAQVNNSEFDWNGFLDELDHSEIEWREAEHKAKSWVTCAVGNQCDIIPRDGEGLPKDWTLRALGREFYTDITERDTKQARETLAKIEHHASVLISTLTTSGKEE